MGRHIKNLTKVLAISFFTLYCLIWILSPFLANYFTNNYALPKGYSLTSNSTIRYNPFTAHLTITELELQFKNGAALRLEQLDAELHLHQFIFDTIYVAEFEISGIYIPVVSKEGSLTIAGFELLKQDKDAIEHEDNQVGGDNSNQQLFPYEIVLPKFNLSDMTIDIEHLGKEHNIEIDSLAIYDVVLSEQEQNVAIELSSHINQARFNFSASTELVRQQGLINVKLDIAEFALKHVNDFLSENLPGLAGKLNYSSQFDIELSEQLTKVNFNNFQLSVSNFHVNEGNFSVNVANQQLRSENLLLTVTPNSLVNLDASFTSSLDAITVKTISDNGQLVEVGDIAIDDISLQVRENKPNVTIGKLAVNEGVFSQQTSNSMPPLAAFKNLSFNNIGYQQDNVSIQDITLSGLIANLLLDENKQLSTLVSLNENSAEEARSQTVEDQSEQLPIEKSTNETNSAIAFSLGEFKLVDNAIIDFKDKSVSPHYERNININSLILANIDTAKPDVETTFDLQGKSDKYANFKIDASGFPFATEQSYKLNAVLKEVSLPGVSSYIKDALMYEIESGQLDVNVSAGLTGTEIDGDVDLLLRGIEFTAADDHEAGTVTDQTSVPFNVALGMLKDSDGNVELSVPLSGDTSSPSFGFSGFLTLLVKQATMSAAKDYLLTTFVPYASVMKVAMAAGEYALKLRINDLNYAAKQVELNDEQLEFTRQMSVMLQDQADINVKLCAIATPADIDASSGEEAHQQANIERLKSISQQRVDLFKAHMVEQLQVPSAKLLLCTPQIDTSENAVSRIEFVI